MEGLLKSSMPTWNFFLLNAKDTATFHMFHCTVEVIYCKTIHLCNDFDSHVALQKLDVHILLTEVLDSSAVIGLKKYCWNMAFVFDLMLNPTRPMEFWRQYTSGNSSKLFFNNLFLVRTKDCTVYHLAKKSKCPHLQHWWKGTK